MVWPHPRVKRTSARPTGPPRPREGSNFRSSGGNAAMPCSGIWKKYVDLKTSSRSRGRPRLGRRPTLWSWKASKCQTPNKAEITRRWRTLLASLCARLRARCSQQRRRGHRNPRSPGSRRIWSGVRRETWLLAFPAILTRTNRRTGKLSSAAHARTRSG